LQTRRKHHFWKLLTLVYQLPLNQVINVFY
jgi:hypothetical protein